MQYSRNKGHDITLYQEEIELQAMAVQLKDQEVTNGRYKYNADGLICATITMDWRFCFEKFPSDMKALTVLK